MPEYTSMLVREQPCSSFCSAVYNTYYVCMSNLHASECLTLYGLFQATALECELALVQSEENERYV